MSSTKVKPPSGMDGTTFVRAKPTVDCSASTVPTIFFWLHCFMIYVSNKCSLACKSVTEVRDNAKNFPNAPLIVPTMFFWVHCVMIFVSNECSLGCKSVAEVRDNAKNFSNAPRIICVLCLPCSFGYTVYDICVE